MIETGVPFTATSADVFGGPGVYALVDTETGCRYVGASVTPAVRLYQHFTAARSGRGSSGLPPAIRKRMSEVGVDRFSVEILERVADTTKLCERERAWIEHFHATDAGVFNVWPVRPRGVPKGAGPKRNRGK